MATYLADVSKSFSRKQAYKFGQTLKFKKDQIDAIAKTTENTTGMDIVLRLFDHTNKASTHLRKAAIDDIHKSLLAAAGTHNANQLLLVLLVYIGIRGNLNKRGKRKDWKAKKKV